MIKSTLLAGVAALAIAGASIANAQTVSVETGQSGAGVTFTPAERTAVRDWLNRQRPVSAREGITVGMILPDDVESYPVPNDWGPSAWQYRYFHSGDRVYFIEPSTRKVVHVFD
jgi:hypothetical protein